MLNKLRKLREKKGFTLVELIVVIAIIAILTAVLVPLIGNWTQQAAYTTLQDAAQTVSNTVNEAISKVVAGGAPLASTITSITGTKSAAGANQLNITVGTATAKADDAKAANNIPQNVALEIAKMLDATMPNQCAFTATISNGAVSGVVYTTSSSTAPGTTGITKNDNFNEAYEQSGAAIGVTGIYKVASSTPSP